MFIPPFQILEHRALKIEDLIELSNTFVVPIHWKVRVMHFYF